MRDPMTPVPGRTFYAGRWRTPEEVERRKALQRVNTQTQRYRSTRSASYRERYASDPDFRERELARNRKNYRPRVRRSADPEKARRRLAEKNLRAREARAEARRNRVQVVKAEVRHKTRAPGNVRSAWKRAHANSVIRRKYPTLAALDASVRTGDFEGSR